MIQHDNDADHATQGIESHIYQHSIVTAVVQLATVVPQVSSEAMTTRWQSCCDALVNLPPGISSYWYL